MRMRRIIKFYSVLFSSNICFPAQFPEFSSRVGLPEFSEGILVLSRIVLPKDITFGSKILAKLSFLLNNTRKTFQTILAIVQNFSSVIMSCYN